MGVLVTLATPDSLNELLESSTGKSLLNFLVITLALSVAVAFLALLYRYSLRRPGRVRRVWPGASVATLLAASASVGLGYYATNIARYALFYGGLAAIVILLLLLWLWSTAILFGAELNIALEDVDQARKLSAEEPRTG